MEDSMVNRLACCLLLVLGTQVSAQHIVRITNKGNKADVISVSQKSQVVRRLQRPDTTSSPWVAGSASDDGAIVALQNQSGQTLDVYDFSTDPKGKQYTLSAGDAQGANITHIADKPTVMVFGRKVYALGNSVVKSAPVYGLMIWDLDRLNENYTPHKVATRAGKAILPDDTLAVVNENGAYLHTGPANKRTLYKVGTR